jgi:hypothetical protein
MGPLVMGHFVMGRFVMGCFVCESENLLTWCLDNSVTVKYEPEAALNMSRYYLKLRYLLFSLLHYQFYD